MCIIRFLVAVALSAGNLLLAQDEPPVVGHLRTLVSAPSDERPASTIGIAKEIQALPAGLLKVKCAYTLAEISFRDDPGARAMEDVAGVLKQALAEHGVDGTDGGPAEPYIDLARLVRYEHAKVEFNDARFTRALQLLARDDRHVEESDFTLKDLQGESFTLSQLRGKVVLVNFWASWCAPCMLEMPEIDDLYTRLKDRGLVVLAISNESESKVRTAVSHLGFRAPVLIDSGAELARRLGLDRVPRTYVFNRDGKLVGVGIDKRSRRQFAEMLASAGLHP
jgi:peroxiredoxin